MIYNLSLAETIGIEVDDYLQWTKQYDIPPKRYENKFEGVFFLENFPEIVIAICPFCGQKMKVKLDLCSLKFWDFSRAHHSGIHTSTWFSRKETIHGQYYRFCEHLAIVDSYLHFKGQPIELVRPEGEVNSDLGPEVPSIMHEYLNAGYGMKAIMQALPLCQIKDGHFRPDLQIYLLCYFLPEPNPRLKYQSFQNVPSSDPWYKLFVDLNNKLVPERINASVFLYMNDYDLAKYVESQQLYWMKEYDFENIYTGDSTEFPFKNIQGRKKDFSLSMMREV